MKEKNEGKNMMLPLLVFLLGIFIGAMDTGIVSPARAVISSTFGISPNLSVWMITIYTLAYAVSMPIAGKLSDKYGKKKIYVRSILLFAMGSALCGASDYVGSYEFLLFSRIIQAIGGGGIVPIATAYIGDSFPVEKRGAALGAVGAVYGIATTLGPTIGSAILSAFGNDNWGVLFFINIPICIAVLIMAKQVKENEKTGETGRMDVKGSVLLSILILSLMYALTNLNFHEFRSSFESLKAWPFLLAFVILMPVFIGVEKKASDPVLNLKYFTRRETAITFIISFVTGCGLMGVVFVPQFGENVLKLKTGSGGYLVTLMAVFSGFAAPIGGKLIDKHSAKLILVMGFGSTIIGSLILALVTAKNPSLASLMTGLAFMGLGMGFSMGTPLNYIIQTNVDKNETASAQSTLSLIRSIGVAISPNLLINFIAEAGKELPSKLMGALPQLKTPAMPGMQQKTIEFASMSGGSAGMSSDMFSKFQNADVTNVTDCMKQFADKMLTERLPQIKSQIMASMTGGKSSPSSHAAASFNPDAALAGWKVDYIAQIEKSRQSIEGVFQSTMNSGFSKLFIAAAIIAAAGLILTLMLSSKKKANV